MKRTISSIRDEIENFPSLSYIPKSKQPRNKKEWISKHAFLSGKIEANKKTKSIFSFPDVIFSILQFLIPSPTSDMMMFLRSLREDTFVLRNVSKDLRGQTPLYSIARRALDNFVPPLGLVPAHYEHVLSCEKKDFFNALDLLETMVLFLFNMYPKRYVHRTYAKKIWDLRETDLDFTNVQFSRHEGGPRGNSCETHIVVWASMACKSHDENNPLVKYFYLNSKYHQHEVEKQRKEDKKREIKEKGKLQERRLKRSVAMGLKNVTNWNVGLFEATRTFKRFSGDMHVATWFTQGVRDDIGKEMVDEILERDFRLKDLHSNRRINDLEKGISNMKKVPQYDVNAETSLRNVLVDALSTPNSKWRMIPEYISFSTHVCICYEILRENRVLIDIHREWKWSIFIVVKSVICMFSSCHHISLLRDALIDHLFRFGCAPREEVMRLKDEWLMGEEACLIMKWMNRDIMVHPEPIEKNFKLFI